jgi:hypothetical protein
MAFLCGLDGATLGGWPLSPSCPPCLSDPCAAGGRDPRPDDQAGPGTLALTGTLAVLRPAFWERLPRTFGNPRYSPQAATSGSICATSGPGVALTRS